MYYKQPHTLTATWRPDTRIPGVRKLLGGKTMLEAVGAFETDLVSFLWWIHNHLTILDASEMHTSHIILFPLNEVIANILSLCPPHQISRVLISWPTILFDNDTFFYRNTSLWFQPTCLFHKFITPYVLRFYEPLLLKVNRLWYEYSDLAKKISMVSLQDTLFLQDTLLQETHLAFLRYFNM